MHIPDAFMPIWQGAIYWVIALVFVFLALRWAKNEMTEEKIPIVAVLAAAVFALMSFNLPVSMGTSGHLVGGALVAIVLGSPFAAVFILTLVLIVQGVLFGDGGLTTMGGKHHQHGCDRWLCRVLLVPWSLKNYKKYPALGRTCGMACLLCSRRGLRCRDVSCRNISAPRGAGCDGTVPCPDWDYRGCDHCACHLTAPQSQAGPC